MTTREKHIGAGLIVALVLVCAVFFVVLPFWQDLNSTKDGLTKVKQDMDSAETTRRASRVLQPKWNKMRQNGLILDESSAQSQSRQAIDDWARESGISLESLTLDRTTQDGGFQICNFVVVFPAKGKGSMQEMSKLIWALETAAIPIRINDMKLTSSQEGTENLMVQLNVSALYLPPGGEVKVGAPASGGHS